MTRLIELKLIQTDELRGKGTEEDPMRRVMQLFTTDGILIFEYDTHTQTTTMTGNLISLLNEMK